MKTYTEAEAAEVLSQLPGWEFKDNGIERNYEFKDFTEAFAFMTRLAILSERANHHAELFNVYNKVHVRFTTHDHGGVTEKDFQLAQELDT